MSDSSNEEFVAKVRAFLGKMRLDASLSALDAEWSSRAAELGAGPSPIPMCGRNTNDDLRRSVLENSPSAKTTTESEQAAAPAQSAPKASGDAPQVVAGLSVLEVNSNYGFVTLAGNESHLWELTEDSVAPVFPQGAGYNLRALEGRPGSLNDAVATVPCSPYMKQAPPTGLPLESFDLRIVYEAGRTGFEETKEFPIVVNSVIAGRYQILQYLDSAAFSRAVRCLDLKHGHEVCIKIIRNSKDFFDQSLDEIKLLQYINCAGDPDEVCVLRLFDFFYFREHIFIVCELLRDNLYEFAKYSREHEAEYYFTLPRVQHIARQVLTALSFLHRQNLLHCDLKPENIVVRSYSRCEVKVIDFGSSCFTTDNLSSYIQSRCYRAPEVILGCHYDGRIDVWSLGAILPELITGQLLFSNGSVPEMLARIAGLCGPFPQSMLHEGRHTCRFVTSQGLFYEVCKETSQLKYHVPTVAPLLTTPLETLGSDDPTYIDFVAQCLTVDHKRRPTAAELLKHPFFSKDYGPVFSAPPPPKS